MPSFRRKVRVWEQERTSVDLPTWQPDVEILQCKAHGSEGKSERRWPCTMETSVGGMAMTDTPIKWLKG
jgi:hypothetical protein